MLSRLYIEKVRQFEAQYGSSEQSFSPDWHANNSGPEQTFSPAWHADQQHIADDLNQQREKTADDVASILDCES